MLRRAVASALQQSVVTLEVVVVDDASTDDTEEVVRGLSDPRLRYFRLEQNGGACVARNVGIEAALGDYVAFLDSDDEWLPTKLHRQITALEGSEHPAAGIVTCGERAVADDGRSTVWSPRYSGWIFEYLLEQRQIGCRTSNLLVRRSVLLEHDIRFDPQLSARQDWDFVAQVARVAQMEIVREPLVVVYHHDGDRVWTPRRAIQAGLYLHDKYQSDLTKRPGAHKRFHLRTALTCIAGGEIDAARAQIRAALEARRYSVLPYVWLVMTYLGGPGKLSLAQRATIKFMRPLTFR